MKFFFSLVLLVSISSVSGKYKIFVIHGYGSPKILMGKINRSIEDEHFLTENYGYKSMLEDLDTLGKQLYVNIKKSGVDSVSFVTHSMGALVVRSMLQYSTKDKNFPIIFRIVMIAPPNRGAEIADIYSSIGIIQKLLGPNIQNMKTDSGSYANKLPVPNNSEIGIIIGIRGKKYGYNPFINGDNDGLLLRKERRWGLRRTLQSLKSEHSLLTQNKTVCKLVIEFLKSGLFLSKVI